MYRENAASVVVVGAGGRVVGLDAHSGERLWVHNLGLDHVEVLVQQNRVFALASNAAQLVILSYPDGNLERVLELPTTAMHRPTMLAHGDVLYVGTGETLMGIAMLTGDLLWEAKLGGNATGSIAIALPGKARQSDDRGSF